MTYKRIEKLRVITVTLEHAKDKKIGWVLYRYTQGQEELEAYLATVLGEGLEKEWEPGGGKATLRVESYFGDSDLEVGKLTKTGGQKNKKIYFMLSPRLPEDRPALFDPICIPMIWYYSDDGYAGCADELLVPCKYDVDKEEELRGLINELFPL